MKLDFFEPRTRTVKRDVTEVYPKFKIKKTKDLMIRGGDFYAIWDEDRGLWSTDEHDAIRLIDNVLREYAEEVRKTLSPDTKLKVQYMWDAESGSIDKWHRYCQKQMIDGFHMLDETLIFANTPTNRKDYASKRLEYSLEVGDYSAFERLISVLYTPEERHKLEWAIGSVISGDSKKLQKFFVLYGAAGTGKSTILNIIQKLFDGYYAVFDARALGSSSNTFALEAFKTNPLVGIQHDGDLSRIEDNTRLNSLVSHEEMTINEKFKSTYTNSFKCLLFMGTNKPVKITDAKSGLIRRLIDISPSGNKVSNTEYKKLVKQVDFELGAIAKHCEEVYLSNPNAYDNYIPVEMLGASNDFYNFILDYYYTFKRDDGVSLKAAWEMYKNYCDEAKVLYPYAKRIFKEELKNYFKEYEERYRTSDGARVRNYYSGFKADKFEEQENDIEEIVKIELIEFESTKSIFDTECADCPAQYATSKETPTDKWDDVKTKLSDLDTSELHYVRVPENHIVIDFDLADADGKKSFDDNVREASKWPPTYAELSKSGKGVHLHYIYTGDVSKLSRVYDEHIEIKVFTGKSSLRRKLSKCNDLPIATISSGLPLKGEKMVNFDTIKNEKGLRTLIKRNLNKEIHPGTKPSIDFIYKILEDAYKSDMKYDVSDMYQAILTFGASSTNQSEYCVKLIGKMQFKSEEPSESVEDSNEKPIVFWDVEVFPNLFVCNWKRYGPEHKVVRMINPSAAAVEELVMSSRLIGFNCRRYDNHIMYAAMMGYSNEQLYRVSQNIINKHANAFFGEAYNLSYTDIYDFASAGNKKSLKKLEIEMGFHHKELGLPWDKPVPEELWVKVAEYCDNDVLATEAAFGYLKGDWTARQILSEIAGLSVNDTTNTLSTKIIFGSNRSPQSAFNYRNLAEPVKHLDKETLDFLKETAPHMMGKRHGPEKSLLPYFPGYKYDFGKSTYRGEEVGEGGYVYAEPGMYGNVALLDIASMHPTNVITEVLFGLEFTKRFKEIVDARVNIKHEAWEIVNGMLNGALTKYIRQVLDGELTTKELATALKTAINSVYGLTKAGFENAFKDIRNVDNIVAKRGALFMVDLKHAVQEQGFTVAHIKTDSIKIPNATPEIIQFVMDFGKEYGYTFEHEDTYERMCLVNDAVYIAKTGSGNWSATGTQFAVPYVFKTLFSKEDIVFDDLCETKSVSSSLYLDMNEALGDDEHNYVFIGRVGRFCPIKPGCGGGELMRLGKNKDGEERYYAVTGTKGLRWLESEAVAELKRETDVDRTYYNDLVTKAVEKISQYGDFERFVSEEPYEVA